MLWHSKGRRNDQSKTRFRMMVGVVCWKWSTKVLGASLGRVRPGPRHGERVSSAGFIGSAAGSDTLALQELSRDALC